MKFLGIDGVQAMAATNSAARNLKPRGKTMHAAGKLVYKPSLKPKMLRPDARKRRLLEAEWDKVLLVADELGLAPPRLLAGISRRAFHGRQRALRFTDGEIMERPFGDVLMQAHMADVQQCNPVLSHSIIEAFCKTPVPGVPNTTRDIDRDGYEIFKQCCQNVVLFTGTHRFLDDDLPALAKIMGTPGGCRVPDDLKARVLARVQVGPDDPRCRPDYVVEGQTGFFAKGAYAAMQWDQVSRAQSLRVPLMAQLSCGPRALWNSADGTPAVDSCPRERSTGQLVYYFQRVDKVVHPLPRAEYLRALSEVNLTTTEGMHGVLGVFVGMRVVVKAKVLEPDVVTGATGEIVDIAFHPQERYGDPASGCARPADTHPCWDTGWVKCDRLPLHVAVRLDESSVDYTGLGMPGVYFLKVQKRTWQMVIDRHITIDHPGAPRPKTVKCPKKPRDVTSYQIPLTHEDDMTYYNVQGKTIRGPEGQPKGFVADLYKKKLMHEEIYRQNVRDAAT
jgi:hypothetical protein